MNKVAGITIHVTTLFHTIIAKKYSLISAWERVSKYSCLMRDIVYERSLGGIQAKKDNYFRDVFSLSINDWKCK
jgi:hypothetical protein